MVAVGNLGNLFATAPLAHAVTRFGWRNTFLAAALMLVTITIAVYLIVRDAPATSQPSDNPVASAGSVYGGTLQAWRLIFSAPAFWFVALLAFFWYANYI